MESKVKKRDYFWNSLGVFSQTITSPILLIVVSRTHGEAGVAIFTLLFSYSIMLWAFNLWGGRTYQVSDLKGEFSLSGYLVVRLLLGIASLVLAIIISIISGFDLYTLILLVMLTLFKTIEAVAETLFGVLQTNNQLFMAGKSLFLKSILGVGLFVLVDILTNSLLLATIAIMMINLFLLICYDYFSVRKWVNYHLKRIYTYVPEAYAIMKKTGLVCIVSAITAVTINIPRVFLFIFHDDELARFGIIAQGVTVASLVIAFIIQPRILGLSKELITNRYEHFSKSVNWLIFITAIMGVLITIGTAFIGAPVLYLIFRIDLSGHWIALITMIIGGIMNAFVLLLFNVLTIMREMMKLFITLIVTNVILILMCIWMVSYWALLGASLAYLICMCVQAIIVFVIYRNSIKRLSGSMM